MIYNNLIVAYLRVALLFLCSSGLLSVNGQGLIQKAGGARECSRIINDTNVWLNFKDTLRLPSNVSFSLPVRMTQDLEISAITLGFIYPVDYLDIDSLEFPSGLFGYTYSNTNGLLILSWADITPVIINAGDTLMIMSMRTLDLEGLAGTIRLGLYPSSEFGDEQANVIDSVVLEIPEIGYLQPDTNDSIPGLHLVAYPNPFKDRLFIGFHLDDASRVVAALFNTAGVYMMQLEDAEYPEGDHEIFIDAVDLAKGIYLVKFEISNAEKTDSEVIKIFSIR